MSESAYLIAAKENGGEARIGCALIALAEYAGYLVAEVHALNETAKATERTVALEEVPSGPALGDPIGYAVITADGDLVPALTVDYLEPTAERARDLIEDQYQRVVAVYDLPQEMGS